MSVFLQPIYTQTVGSGGAASITFNNIPQTFTDLKLVMSMRDTAAGSETTALIQFNSDTTSSYNFIMLYGASSTNTGSYQPGSPITGGTAGFYPTSDYAANTFSSSEIYIPNYAGSNYKQYTCEAVAETNSSTSWRQGLYAGLWIKTSAISTIKLISGTAFAQYSTFSLYGITKG